MSANIDGTHALARPRIWKVVHPTLVIALLWGAAVGWSSAVAQESLSSSATHRQVGSSAPAASDVAPSAPKSMDGMDMDQKPADAAQPTPKNGGGMTMGSMQDGSAPSNARDPNAYADGYDYGSMPGMEQADRILVSRFLVDQLEFTHGTEGDGLAWDIHEWYGGDDQKLLLRTEGGIVNGAVDFTTGGEALWWRALTAFWGTVLGVGQEFGSGAHTQLAFGVEGLAPYWLQVEGTGYVAEDGRLSARLKGSYDLLFTNRLILTPEVETNLFSRTDVKRGVHDGVNNVELSLRLRYEYTRKFAPYIGFDWDRTFAHVGRAESNPQFVAGLRLLW